MLLGAGILADDVFGFIDSLRWPWGIASGDLVRKWNGDSPFGLPVREEKQSASARTHFRLWLLPSLFLLLSPLLHLGLGGCRQKPLSYTFFLEDVAVVSTSKMPSTNDSEASAGVRRLEAVACPNKALCVERLPCPAEIRKWCAHQIPAVQARVVLLARKIASAAP